MKNEKKRFVLLFFNMFYSVIYFNPRHVTEDIWKLSLLFDVENVNIDIVKQKRAPP